jgi:tetratricopeptide (TPR) repeat protein
MAEGMLGGALGGEEEKPEVEAPEALAGAEAFAAAVAAKLAGNDPDVARDTIVEPFDAPPAFAASGVTGKVVASGLLDKLRELQNSTRADAVRRNLSSTWDGEIKMEVPEVGVSFGELSRILKARFGHDLHIGGDLVQMEGGAIALTVRGDDIASRTFTGAATNLAKLTTDAAEYIYSQSEPVLWAYYLINQGRDVAALEFCRGAISGADKSDRPYLLNTWGSATRNLGDLKESLELTRAALKLKPDYWIAYNNIQVTYAAMGDEEDAWRAAEEMRRVAGGRPGRAPEDNYLVSDTLTGNFREMHDALVADADAHGGIGTRLAGGNQLLIADSEIDLHDPSAAAVTLQTVKPDATNKSSAVIVHLERARLAMELGHVLKATEEMEAFAAGFIDPAIVNDNAGDACFIAPVEEAAGHPKMADAVLKSAGTFVDCYRFLGDILDHRGDWEGAQKAYVAAVTLAPDLPAGYFSWGAALAKHGDMAGAEAKLKDANQRGPHWADPLKVWGDVLVKQGKAKEALGKYDEALKYAPNWKQLKEAREALAKKS